MSIKTVDAILKGVLEGERLDDDSALALLKSHELLAIGKAADTLCRGKHPDGVVTYIVDRNVNYTNVCVSACRFCAFYKTPGHGDAYLITDDQILEKIDETIKLGGKRILLQGGLHPKLQLEWYENLLRVIKGRGIGIHGFSGPEIAHISRISKLSIADTIARLQKAGLDSIPGGGAEILVDRVRDIVSPNKCSADEWIEVMRQAGLQGMRATATMMFGHEETLRERIESLGRIRELQDETGVFTAFIPWPFQPKNTDLEGRAETGGFEYLKTLAVSRLYLDNIDNIQASWVTQGAKIAQLSLYFGANDMGSTMIEENVVASAGVSFRLTEKEIRRLVEDAGFTARRRVMDYSPGACRT